MLGNGIAVLSGVCYAGVFLMNSFEKSDSLSSIFIGQALSAATCIWFVFGESDFGATAMGGILVYAPDGTPLGRIITPTETENFCFGGPDLKTVYTASKGSVYSFRMRVPGNPSPYDKLYYKE